MDCTETNVSAVQLVGRPEQWDDHMTYVGMPGNAARAYGITDAAAGPFGKPWVLLEDPRGWETAYREYLWTRLHMEPDFRGQVRMLHGRTLLCWCLAKEQRRGVPVACHANILARAVEWLAHDAEATLLDRG